MADLIGVAIGASVGKLLFCPAPHAVIKRREIPPCVIAGATTTTTKDGGEEEDTTSLLGGELDVRRMAQIAWGRATDHAGEVVILPKAEFDINKTIFVSLDSALLKRIQTAKIGITLFWSDAAAFRITQAFSSVPRAPCYDRPLVDFMQQECDFAVEHADGSFMDHLRFCYEYSAAHYSSRSPRVLLLHSIMGVGTNFFPMPADKIPALKALLTEEEYGQVEMFPTMLRLFYHGPLRDQLEGMSHAELNSIESITAHRVLDNAEITMSGPELWAQLNYQLIHLLDFLPAASWKLHEGDNFLDAFTALYAILVKAGKLQARVDFDATEAESTASGQPVTLAGMLRGALPSEIQLKMARKQITGFSHRIGHSLEYKLVGRRSDITAASGSAGSARVGAAGEGSSTASLVTLKAKPRPAESALKPFMKPKLVVGVVAWLVLLWLRRRFINSRL